MKQNSIYAIYDKVSETFIGSFIAVNEKVAIRNYEHQFEGNSNVNKKDFELCCVSSVSLPMDSEDLCNCIVIAIPDDKEEVK